jgi:hypothetical protein
MKLYKVFFPAHDPYLICAIEAVNAAHALELACELVSEEVAEAMRDGDVLVAHIPTEPLNKWDFKAEGFQFIPAQETALL